MISRQMRSGIALRLLAAVVAMGLSSEASSAGWPEWQAARTAGIAALARDDVPGAAQSFEAALAIAEATDAGDRRLSETLVSLAEVRFAQSRDDEAEMLYRRALAIDESIFGADSAEVAETLRLLADLLFFQDRYDDAEPLYLRALTIAEQLPAPESAIAALNGLGRFYNFVERESEALAYLERSLALQTERDDPEQLELAATMDAMAEAHFYLDGLDDSEMLYRRSLTLRESTLGPNHSAVAGSVRRLATIVRMLGRGAEADELTDRALDIERNQPLQ